MTDTRRLRLLFVLPDLSGGGAQRVTLNLLAALAPERYAVTLLVLEHPGALSYAVPPQIRLLHAPPSPGRRRSKLAVLREALRHDVLIAALEERATYYVHFAARLLRKPVIAWVHIAFGERAQAMSKAHCRRSRAAYRDIRHLVFVSEGARRSMAQWLGREDPRWQVLPNAFIPTVYGDDDARAPALLARMSQRPAVLGIGRLEPRKGFDLLIDAAAQALNAGADFDLVILGEGALRGALQQQAQRLGIADRVFMPGYVDDPLRWLRAAKLYVLSSRLEGLSTTIIEAMSVGTPVIATDCPSGPAELLADGAGLLLPVDDAAAMARAIRRLLSEPQTCAQFAARGHMRVLAFEPQSVASRWEALIAEATASARPARRATAQPMTAALSSTSAAIRNGAPGVGSSGAAPTDIA